MKKISDWLWLILLVLLTTAGGWLRFSTLGADPLWLDEAAIWQIAVQPTIREMIKANAFGNSAPLLFVFVVRFLMLFGDNEFVLRIGSAFAGTIAVPCFYFFLKRFVTWPLALAGAAIIAFSPAQIAFSQELREYSFAVLFCLLILWAYDVLLNDPSWRRSEL